MLLHRNQFVISRKKRLIEFASLLEGVTDASKAFIIQKASKIDIPLGATLNNFLTDCLSLKLILNGGKYNLSPLGKKLVMEPENITLWKEAYLNVPLYKEFNEKYTENQDYNLFVEYTYQHYDIPRNLVKLFGMGVRRFFEGYHQISLPARIKKPRRKIRGRHRTYILQENLIPTKVSVSEKIKNHITNPSDDNFESYLELHRKVKELINLYGMTKVKKIIELEQVE